jgi:hypothetical protein
LYGAPLPVMPFFWRTRRSRLSPGAKRRLAAKSSKNGRIFVVPARDDDRTRFFYQPGSIRVSVGRYVDKQTKREIWLLAIGTIIVEMPVAFTAFAVFSH